MYKLSIIGSSKIIEDHIKAAKKNKFQIYSIYSTNKKSKKVLYLKKKYKINKIYKNLNLLIKDTKYQKKLSFLIAPRIKDTYKILRKLINKNNYFFLEKPVTTKIYEFNKLLKFKEKIFIGYNRIFYENIKYLKKNLRNPHNIIVKCPEINTKSILTNSVHVLSILFFLFGNLKILKKTKGKNYINVVLNNEYKINIHLFFNFNSAENFSIEIYENKIKYELKPLEKLIKYNFLKISYINKNKKPYKIYKPIFSKYINEFNQDNYKPGFYNQWKLFYEFVSGNKEILNNINFAKKIMVLAKKIAS